ncbi:MAG: sugar phosphate isomerase/epimerase [Anaerolineae bacterium]|nr:sugar phosphate isomerase/epimerase [Anaerolineae bacterium]
MFTLPMLGAQLYTVRAFTQTVDDIAASLKRVAAIGYPAIQISGFGLVAPQKVAQLVEEAGLTVAATHMPWERFLHATDEVIAIHKLWGCCHAAIGGLPEEYYTLEGIRRFVAELEWVATALAAEGIDFSYHNHRHEFRHYPVDGGHKPWLELLLEQAPPSLLNIELDTYWVQAGGGDPAAWIRRCAGRIPVLHLKDMTIGPEGEQRMAEVGEGNLNWTAILRAAQESGVKWTLVEQDDCYGKDPFEALALSYCNIHALWRQLPDKG